MNATNSKQPVKPNGLKVLMLLSNAFDPDPRVHQEAKALVQAGYHVTIVCWDRDLKAPSMEVVDGIRIERVYVRSTHGRGSGQMLYLFLFWTRAFVKALGGAFNVIHCHDFDTLPLGFVLAKSKKAKLVYDSHESYVDMLVNVPLLLRRLMYNVENVLLKETDLLITVGDILRVNFQERGAKKTCVVGNWKDPAEFIFPENLINQEKKRLKINNGQMVVNFIANLGYERQLPQLIEAVKDMPEVFLILGGDGPASHIAKEAANQSPNIEYLGYVHPSKVSLYTAISDVIFYGFDPKNPNARFSAPNKLFEGIAAGKAILTGDFGEISHIVREAGCGLVLQNYSYPDIRQALLRLRTDFVAEAVRGARDEAREKYRWENASHELIKQYKGLAE
ncbi:MAG: glycosyltransferase family 4 protein [Candidatus Hodarchaeota archaeon]